MGSFRVSKMENRVKSGSIASMMSISYFKSIHWEHLWREQS